MFGSYYYNQKYPDAPRDSIDTATSALIWTGAAITAAIAAKPMLQSGAASFLRSTATGPSFLQKIAAAGSKIIRGGDDAAIKVFSDDVVDLASGGRDVVESVVASETVKKRTNLVFETLQDSVTKGADILLKQEQKVKALIHQRVRSSDIAEARRGLTDAEFTDSFSRLVKGVSFNQKKDDIFISAASKAYKDVEISRSTVAKSLETPGFIDSAVNAMLEQSIKQQRKNAHRMNTVLGNKTQGFRNIQIKDLVTDVSYSGSGLKYKTTKLGNQINNDIGQDVVGQLMKRHEESVIDMFGSIDTFSDPASTAAMSLNKYLKGFMNSRTGILRDVNNPKRLVYKSLMEKSLKSRVNQIAGEFSIPLLPGAFQVKAKSLFKFARRDDDFVKNLGPAYSQPELRRKFGLTNSDDSLISIGNRIIKLGEGSAKTLDGEFSFFNKNLSLKAKEAAQIRSSIKENRSGLKMFAGEESSDHKFKIAQHKFMDLALQDGKIIVTPKKSSVMGMSEALVAKSFKNPLDANIHELNHKQLLDVVRLAKESGDTATMIRVGDHVISMSDSAHSNDITYNLIKAKEFLDKEKINLDPNLTELLDAVTTSSPEKIYEALQAGGFFKSEAKTALKEKPALFKAVENIRENLDTFFDVDTHETSFEGKFKDSILGEKSANQLVINIQKAMLEESMEAIGRHTLTIETPEVLSLVKDGKSIAGTNIANMFRDVLGISKDVQGGDSIAESIITSSINFDDMVIDERELSPILKLIGGRYLTRGQDPFETVSVQQVISKNLIYSYHNYDSNILRNSVAKKIATNATEDHIIKGLDKKFGRFSTQVNTLEESFTDASRYYVTINEGFDSTFKAIVDNSAPATTASFVINSFLQAPDEIARGIGIGLSNYDKRTTASYFGNLFLKRILPLYGVLGAYQTLNDTIDKIGIPGLDDVAANFFANVNLQGATIKDVIGYTSLLKKVQDYIPGLDQYITPRSREEYEEYLAYGNEEVRSGRGWLVGNLNALPGSRVSHFRPNFYRRWKSNFYSQDSSSYMVGGASEFSIGTGLGGFGGIGGSSIGGEFGIGDAYSSGVGATLDVGNYLLNQTGLYGGLASPFLGVFSTRGAPDSQPSGGVSIPIRMLFENQYGEIAGPFGEYVRRIINYSDVSIHAEGDQIRNNMPEWLPYKFKYDNPYLKTRGTGELLLPGPSYEKTRPWARPEAFDLDYIAATADQMVENAKNFQFIRDRDTATDFANFRRQVITELKGNGAIAVAVPLYDSGIGIKGTIDAVMSSSSGNSPVLVSLEEELNRSELKLQAAMGAMGAEIGYLAIVDPSSGKISMQERSFDAQEFREISGNIRKARQMFRRQVLAGESSPYDTYDLLTRLDVLSKTAPNSVNYQNLLSYAEDTAVFNTQQQLIFNQLKNEANRLKNGQNLYPYRNELRTKGILAKVEGFTEDGTVITDKGKFRVAGVEVTPDGMYSDWSQILGIREGETTTFHVNNSLDPDAMKDVVTPAMFKNATNKLISSGLARELNNPDDPIDFYAINGTLGIAGATIEKIMHTDFLVLNKFFRVRSPLEQFKRGEVYGSDFSSWKDPVNSMLAPVLTAFFSKDPVTSAAQTALTASFFVRSQQAKINVAATAAVVGLAGSIAHKMNENILRGRYNKQAELDEYFDKLEYIKYEAIERSARVEAVIRGENASLENPDGEFSKLAKSASERKSQTMFGFDMQKGTLEDAIKSLPLRQQQIAREIVLYSSQKDKDEFFSLLAPEQKRVLAKFLGQDVKQMMDHIINDTASLEEYFADKFLPDKEWKGWSPSVDLGSISRAASRFEGLYYEAFSDYDRKNLEKVGSNVVPIMNAGDRMVSIKERLKSIYSQLDMVELDFKIATSNSIVPKIDVNLNIKTQNQDRQIIHQDILRA